MRICFCYGESESSNLRIRILIKSSVDSLIGRAQTAQVRDSQLIQFVFFFLIWGYEAVIVIISKGELGIFHFHYF